MESNKTKLQSLVEHAGSTVVQIPWGYQLTAIPGWAYSAELRMYYFIPEQQFVPRDEVWVDELKAGQAGAESKRNVSGTVHPNLIATGVVSMLSLMLISMMVAEFLFGFFSAGARFALFISLFICMEALMFLLFTRPTDFEIQAYSRKK